MEIALEVNPKIFILLPVHNRKNITIKFIDCLLVQTYQNYQLLLIDDGCSDGTVEMVQSRVKNLTVLKGKGRWWWAGSLQQGYNWLKSKKINSDYMVLIMNDDTTFEKDFLSTGVRILSQNSHTLLGAQAYSLQDNHLIDKGVSIDWSKFSFRQAQSPADINCISTRGLFIYAGDFLKLNGFFPRILPHYSSDYEFTIRAHRKGMRLFTDPSLKLYGDEQASGQRKFASESVVTHIKEVFSKSSVRNPIYSTIFVLLACPWKWKIKNVTKIWIGIVRGGIRRTVMKLML